MTVCVAAICENGKAVVLAADKMIGKPGEELTPVNDEEVIEEELIPICQALEPRDLRKRDRKVLNALKELRGFDQLKEPPKKRRKKSPMVPIA